MIWTDWSYHKAKVYLYMVYRVNEWSIVCLDWSAYPFWFMTTNGYRPDKDHTGYFVRHHVCLTPPDKLYPCIPKITRYECSECNAEAPEIIQNLFEIWLENNGTEASKL